MDMNSALSLMKSLGACSEAVKWFKSQSSVEEAWTNCNHTDWLIWIAGRLGIDKKILVLLACECAESVLEYIPKGEERPRLAIEAARGWCKGEVGADEVHSAAAAAYATAANAAAYATAAANAAAYAAAYAAYAATAAAYAATAATNAATNAANAANAATNDGEEKIIRIVKNVITWDLIQKQLKETNYGS